MTAPETPTETVVLTEEQLQQQVAQRLRTERIRKQIIKIGKRVAIGAGVAAAVAVVVKLSDKDDASTEIVVVDQTSPTE